MRIIAGIYGSRTLKAPEGLDTRPTLDRTRESLFNIIQARCPDAQVLDLYAGSGALALEAISRGAASAVVCDCSAAAQRALRYNIVHLALENRVRMLPLRDDLAIRRLENEHARFDLVFLDPPYRLDASAACSALGEHHLLMDGALVIIEHAAETPPQPDAHFERTDLRRYRDTAISFFCYHDDRKERSHE